MSREHTLCSFLLCRFTAKFSHFTDNLKSSKHTLQRA